MTVILISGKARAGKTTVAKIIQQKYGGEIIPFAKHLKAQAVGLGWSGEKDDKGRTLLQKLGDIVKEYHGLPYYSEVVLESANEVTIIDDWRYPYEKDVFGKDVITIRVERKHENGLSLEQKLHESETSLDNYEFDYVIDNNGTLDELCEKI